MNGMFWRNLNKEGVYHDENYRRFPYNARLSFYRLATELYYEGKNEKAKEVINHCFEVIPDKTIPYDVTSPQFVSILLKCGDKAKAMEISNTMAKRADEELGYYIKNNIKNEMEIQSNLYVLNQLAMILKSEGLTEESRRLEEIFRKYAGENYQ